VTESDWTHDPEVVRARDEFDARRQDWLGIAPPNQRLPEHPTPAQQSAHDRMHLADCEYTLARDAALERHPRSVPESLLRPSRMVPK
jgi:hypothetical protein